MANRTTCTSRDEFRRPFSISTSIFFACPRHNLEIAGVRDLLIVLEKFSARTWLIAESNKEPMIHFPRPS